VTQFAFIKTALTSNIRAGFLFYSKMVQAKMKQLSTILILYILLASGCEKNKYDAPGCIEEKIDDFIANVICDKGAYVALYKFNEDDVYLFYEGDCGADLGGTVYSSDCLRLGFLGGIDGNKFIQGVSFYDYARYVKRIWEN
jgi:hypothetical protein